MIWVKIYENLKHWFISFFQQDTMDSNEYDTEHKSYDFYMHW